MRGTRISTLSFLMLSAAASLTAAQPDYLPLQVGNSWLYSGPNGGSSAEITGIETVGNRKYFAGSYFGRDVLLRLDESNTIYSVDAKSGVESVWVRFGETEGASFPSSIDPCVATGRIVSKAEEFKGPFGSFNTVLHVSFEPSCSDAGVTDAWFLPYIGLIRYTITTIAGPRTFDLVNSKTGLTEVSTGLLSTRISLNPSSITAGQNLLVRVSVANSGEKPVVLEFRDAQRIDVAIKDEKGEVVALWSKGRLFAQVTGSVPVGPGERSWAVTVELPELPPGTYTAEAWVTASNFPARSFAASAAFQVVEKAK